MPWHDLVLPAQRLSDLVMGAHTYIHIYTYTYTMVPSRDGPIPCSPHGDGPRAVILSRFVTRACARRQIAAGIAAQLSSEYASRALKPPGSSHADIDVEGSASSFSRPSRYLGAPYTHVVTWQVRISLFSRRGRCSRPCSRAWFFAIDSPVFRAWAACLRRLNAHVVSCGVSCRRTAGWT